MWFTRVSLNNPVFATMVMLAIVVLAASTVVVAGVAEPALLPGVAAGIALLGTVTWLVRNVSVTETVIERAAEAAAMSEAEQYLAGADDVATLGAGAFGSARMADRVVELSGGRVLSDGPPPGGPVPVADLQW